MAYYHDDEYGEVIPDRYSWVDDDIDIYAIQHANYQNNEPPVTEPALEPIRRKANPLKHKIISTVAIVGFFMWIVIRIIVFLLIHK